ncbi:MAG: DUF1684 domain-containing protein [Chloroflexi bacterium]|nr:DUF1684 domain-containing protein [Chloroflexota bacterium]
MNTMNPLQQFRAEIDQFMRLHPQSPLGRGQRPSFTGLNYYEPSTELLFVTWVEFLDRNLPPVKMETSTGDEREQYRWGRVQFEVEGQLAELTIYSDYEGEALFLPFKDQTNGRETYGAGRYLDNHRPGLRRIGADQLELDFNYAYNPYCAYSPDYSCPLPPRENWLAVPIRAGEKLPNG